LNKLCCSFLSYYFFAVKPPNNGDASFLFANKDESVVLTNKPPFYEGASKLEFAVPLNNSLWLLFPNKPPIGFYLIYYFFSNIVETNKPPFVYLLVSSFTVLLANGVILANKPPAVGVVLVANNDPEGFGNKVFALGAYYFLSVLLVELAPKRELWAGFPPIPPNNNLGASSDVEGFDTLDEPKRPPYFLSDVFNELLETLLNSPPLVFPWANNPPDEFPKRGEGFDGFDGLDEVLLNNEGVRLLFWGLMFLSLGFPNIKS